DVLIPLSLGFTVTYASLNTTIARLVETGGGTLSVSSGSFSFANDSAIDGQLVQSGGLLTSGAALTVSGASAFSGGTQSGSGTTNAQGGAAFGNTTFGLDGGRTLQLGGSNVATGTFGQINLNGANPNTGVSDAGSGILTIASGSTFNDQTS